MSTTSQLAIAALVGAAVSGAAVYGLQAQGKKAYTVTELQTLDAKLGAEIAPRVIKAQAEAGGHTLNTGAGKVVALEGTPPQRVAITQWDSLEKAQAFWKSKAWTDILPERNTAQKTIRQYIVEER